MASVKKFEDLEIWQLSRRLCNDIYTISESTELKNNFKLRNQIDGSSGSIMDNIAEGFERNGNREFIQFLSIAKASCGETRSQLYRVFDRSLVSLEKFETLREQTEVLSRKISSFIKYLNLTDLKGTKYRL
ncbi:four helix bundle protein [Chryseobacterium paridis]|uniref:Four helix bundle protein n=1 Tax=Chryseobacterium paridis TaxID=2800328 RepID=A0ABS1FYN3_9FLAO|nr:four helix bundle protein [Chryseobacterium paridis]MBK1897510.1 four helix bundle protein [Chryseobacterium paridis]